jgi:hypothetical protein
MTLQIEAPRSIEILEGVKFPWKVLDFLEARSFKIIKK